MALSVCRAEGRQIFCQTLTYVLSPSNMIAVMLTLSFVSAVRRYEKSRTFFRCRCIAVVGVLLDYMLVNHWLIKLMFRQSTTRSLRDL